MTLDIEKLRAENPLLNGAGMIPIVDAARTIGIEPSPDVCVAMDLLGRDAPARELVSLVARMHGTKPIDVRAMKRKVDTIKKHLGLSL
ncbi:hypothetical protein [Burkholderia ubonensis]|uniref:hypothetical protein n=1 Tax=Burkholderia ubonensis TaxID=101571 RepID=UPI00075492E0|nr:hypothetical protein [Burkholderia ubonensis]KVU97206.1 hypothetical protein WK77_01750 [Burkholderia ubonensis]KVZ52076.1 hypothetical protein WL16_16720 [Burkholderia ubonensis]